MGWTCTNGDILRDVIEVIRWRMAQTRFIWIKAHIGNNRGDRADALAKEGARLPPLHGDYERLTENPWAAMAACWVGQSERMCEKVSTNLPEFAPPRVTSPEAEVAAPKEVHEGHRGRQRLRTLQKELRLKLLACNTPREFWQLIRSWGDERPQAAQVTLAALAEEMQARINYLPVVPESFNVVQLEFNKALSEALPKETVDETENRNFSSPIQVEEIAWAKAHVQNHTKNAAAGIDNFSNVEILRTPNEQIRMMFQACLDRKSAPSEWLVSVIIGIPKKGKDLRSPKNYRLIVLECSLLKMLMLIIDKRARQYAEEQKIIPESQNGFRPGYRTNNNPFILRCLAEKAHSIKKPLYVVYMDLKNAFPSTDRSTLWVKLHEMGFRGIMIDWVKMIYDRMKYIVRLGGEFSNAFEAFLGLLTGDPTSPGFWNLFLADFKVTVHVDDVCLNGMPVPKLEHADDIALISTTSSTMQSRLEETEKFTGNNGCENQLVKCVYSCHTNGIKQSIKSLYLGAHMLQEVKVFQYVGIYIQTDKKDMFERQYQVNAEKAGQMANMCLAVNRIVGGLPVWEARALYMARVDPYLTNGCDVSLDVVKSNLSLLEDVQIAYLRKMLGMGSRSMIAVLFSQTGIMPIRYRRILLALGYLKYLLSLPAERLAWNALMESYGLARAGQISWVNDLKLVMQSLPVPVYWDINAEPQNSTLVDRLIKLVEQSMNSTIQTQLENSSRMKDMVVGRKEIENKRLVFKALAFRHYLRVKTHTHRIALTHIVLSGHALAMERMRWSQRGHPGILDKRWRLC